MNRAVLIRSVAGAGLALAIGMAGPSIAAGDADFSLGLEAGIAYDSNVGVAGVGQSGEGDTVYHFGLDAGAEIGLTDNVSLNVAYGFSIDQYQDFSTFSQQNHSILAGLQAQLNDLTLGFTYTYIATLLDGDGFLNMQVISPSIAGFVSDSVYLRAAYTRYEKDFDTLNARDASSDIGNLDAFIFFDEYRSFLNLRATVEQEDADGSRFDYDGFAVGAFLELAVDGFGRENTLELGASYRKRDYENITPSIGTTRRDEKLEFEVALEVPLTEVAHIRGSYKNAVRTSNLPVADYNEQIVSFLLGLDF